MRRSGPNRRLRPRFERERICQTRSATDGPVSQAKGKAKGKGHRVRRHHLQDSCLTARGQHQLCRAVPHGASRGNSGAAPAGADGVRRARLVACRATTSGSGVGVQEHNPGGWTPEVATCSDGGCTIPPKTQRRSRCLQTAEYRAAIIIMDAPGDSSTTSPTSLVGPRRRRTALRQYQVQLRNRT